jgi:hypothetical protein
MNISRTLRIGLLAGGALLTLALAGLIVWFWRLQIPNADARHLEALFRTRQAPAESGNGFFDVYAFTAPEGADPHALGAARLAWVMKLRRAGKAAGADPMEKELTIGDLRSDTLKRIGEVCRESSARECADSVRATVENQPLSKREALLLARYQALIRRPHWFEPLSFRTDEPIPPYNGPIDAQRMTLIRLHQALRRGDTAGVREALQADLLFWRRMLVSTDSLIGKMIAVAGIRNHFTFANLALRELPPLRASELMPPSWQEPLSDAERSMWRAMAGEYVFVQQMVESIADGDNVLVPQEYGNPLERLFGRMARRIQPPRLANSRASLYASVAREFAAPLGQYEKALAAVLHDNQEADDAEGAARYAMRVGSVEGMRRATLLVFELRRRAVPPAAVAGEVAESQWRAPFDGKPFEWKGEEQAIVYQGPEKKRRALALYY